MEFKAERIFTVWRILVLVYALAFSLILSDAVSEFISLPSPPYGGDYYFQMGCFYHIMEGGDPLDSSSMIDEVPGYMPVYPFLGSIYCGLTETKPMECMLDFSVIVFFFSVILWFLALNVVFKDEKTALFATILVTSLLQHPVLKYTDFTAVVVFPLFLLVLYKTFEEKKSGYFAVLGIFYGLLPLTHMMLFIGATFIIGLFFLNEIYIAVKKREEQERKKMLKNIIIFSVLAIVFLMLYWYRPIFEWGLEIPYDRTHMDVIDVGRSDVQMQFLAERVAGVFRFDGASVGMTILFLFGIYTLIKSRNDMGHLEKFIIIFSVASVLATFSYFITEPLLGMNFVPAYLARFTFSNAVFLISAYGLNVFLTKSELFSEKVRVGIVAVYILLFLVYVTGAFEDKMETNRWMEVGKTQGLSGMHLSLQEYILENTEVNDVFLSTKELSFVMNSLSGRKLVVNRWAQQNNPYTDMPQRDEDAAVIFYGNDVEEKLGLLEEYNVLYFYWDAYWINSEYRFNEQGQMVSIYDPLLTMDSEENRQYLEENGVGYQAMHFWIDPAMRSDDIRKFDLLFVSPENYYTFEHPWNPNLDPYLEKVWEYEENGVTYAVLYKVNAQ